MIDPENRAPDQLRTSEIDMSQTHCLQVTSRQRRIGQTSAVKDCTAQIYSVQVGAFQVCRCEVRAGKGCREQRRVSKARTGERGSGQIRAPQEDTVQVRAGKLRMPHSSAFKTRVLEIDAGKVGIREIAAIAQNANHRSFRQGRSVEDRTLDAGEVQLCTPKTASAEVGPHHAYFTQVNARPDGVLKICPVQARLGFPPWNPIRPGGMQDTRCHGLWERIIARQDLLQPRECRR